MDEFLFCLEIIRREVERFNLTINSTTASNITAATSENINFDIALNRCSYLYRCGTINMCFAKECFAKFFSDYKSIVFLLSKWISHPNLTVCSLTCGPALDYIAFLSAYKKCGKFPSLFKDIKVISKYGAWRNTVNIMHQTASDGYLKCLPNPVPFGNIEVIQGDPFKDFTQKVENPISNSDVVIMMKKLNLQADLGNQDITKSVQEFLAALKTDAILFCIDTKPAVALITKEISSFDGTYLLQPTFMQTSITLELTDFYKDIFGCYPVISARGSFFVWQKSSKSPSFASNLMDEVSESVKRLLKINGDNIYCDKSSQNSFDKLVTHSSCFATPTHSSSSTFAEKHDECFMSNDSSMSIAKESEGNDLLFADSGIVSDQNSRNFSPSSSLQNNCINYESIENILINEMPSKCILFNKCTQTESLINFKNAESVKIAALTEKVVRLTSTINNLLQTNEMKDVCMDYVDGDCSKQTEEMEKGSICCGSVPNYSSTVISCLHDCHSGCPENLLCNCPQEKNSGNHMHKEGCLACSHLNSSISLGSNYETTKCNTPCHELKSTEKKSVPKLVIPLSNIPGHVVAQIVSLISQSNSD